jgi:hypothetical protein
VTNIIIAKNREMNQTIAFFLSSCMKLSNYGCVYKWQSMCGLHHKRVILDLKLRGQKVGVHHKMVFSVYVIVGGEK